MRKKKRSSGIRFTYPPLQTRRRTADTTFTPITLESLGIAEQPPLLLSGEQDMLLDAFLEVEAERMAVEFLQDMTHPRNPTRHKELLAEHTTLLRAAVIRLEKRSVAR